MRILYIQYTDPASYPPLEHGSYLFANEGWKVLFLGIEAPDTRNFQLKPHNNIRVKLFRSWGTGSLQKLHYCIFSVWVLLGALFWRPQWVYASDPFSCGPAWLISLFSKVPVIYHEHDSPSPQPRGPALRFFGALRRRLARRAFLCILPQEERRRIFIEQTGVAEDKVICVHNFTRRDEVRPERQTLSKHEFWVLYQGSVGPSRLPLTFIDAFSLLPGEVKLRIIGYESIGSYGYLDALRQKAKGSGIGSRVQFIDAMPRAQMLDWCHRSDVGVVFSSKNPPDDNMRYMVGASNKIFDYLSSGLALLVSDLPDWNLAYVQPGYGLSCDPDDPQSAAAAIRRFFDHPEETRRMGEKGRRRILEEWNYDAQFKPVLERIHAARH